MSRNTQLNTPSGQTKACIYAYTAQTRSPDVKTQIEACRAVAAASGLTVVKTEIDGGRGPRDGLARVLQAAESDVFDTLIVKTLDRISRKTEDLWPVLVRLHMHKINLVAVDSGVIDLEKAGFEMTDHRPMVAKRVHAYVAPNDGADDSCSEADALAELQLEVREQGGVISSITSDWANSIEDGRDGLSDALQIAAQGGFDVLVVHNFGSMGYSLGLAVDFWRAFDKANVAVWSVESGLLCRNTVGLIEDVCEPFLVDSARWGGSRRHQQIVARRVALVEVGGRDGAF